MSRDSEYRLRLLISRQDGLVTLDQARDHEVSREAVARKVAAKEWIRVGYRVYQDASHQPSDRATVRAAMLSLGEDAVLVGAGAAWWWGLREDRPRRFRIAIGEDHHQRGRPGVQLVRRTVPANDRTMHRGLRVTTTVATVLDAAAELGTVEGAKVFDTALQRRKVTVDGLRAGRTRRSGRPGAVLLARLIALAAGGAVSEAERVAHGRLRLAAIVGWVANLAVDVPGFGRAVLDIGFPDLKVYVEVDGWAYHRDLRAFVHDAARQNALTAAGWTVIRTNWHELMNNPEAFVAALRRVLAGRS